MTLTLVSLPNQAVEARPLEDGDALGPALRDLVEAFVAFSDAAAKGVEWTTTGPVAFKTLPWWQDAPKLSECEAGRRLAALPPADKARVAVEAYVQWARGGARGPRASALRRIAAELMRGKLDLEADQALALAAAAQRGFDGVDTSPNRVAAGALKRHVDSRGLSPELRVALAGVRASMIARRVDAHLPGRELLKAVDAMLAPSWLEPDQKPRFEPKPDAWGRALEARLAGLSFELRAEATPLLVLAGGGGDAAKPTKTWLKQAEQALARVNRERVGALLLDIIGDHEPGVAITLENRNALRALIWLAAMAANEAAVRALESYAVKCLTWVGYDYLCLVLGNAAIHAFTLMPGGQGVGGLARLKRRLSRPGEIKAVEKAIAALAEARGVTPGEIEEIGLPDYGFGADGSREIVVGSARARLVITEASVLETVWSDAGGKPLFGPPAAVKAEFGKALAALKAEAKEIGETLKAQRMRLESLYLEERAWNADLWRRLYLDEPLLRGLVRRLIWSFGAGDRWTAAIAADDRFYDVSGQPLDAEISSQRVRLWHPLQTDRASVLAWRRRLAELGVTQPFKQAHREIYALNAPEAETATYSNRFGGHFVEQAKFRALCHARLWACPAFGLWAPTRLKASRRLAARGLQAEIDIDPLVETHAWGERDDRVVDERTGMARILMTGRIRFLRDGEEAPLATVSPVVFSEIMRDVDLFVSVAGIANDPSWADRNGGRVHDYQRSTAEGPLGETGETRRDALRDLLPGLPIASRCRLHERHLEVEGELTRYRIHLGSGHVVMSPSDLHLRLAADAPQKPTNAIRLPFEDDATLSLILSRAFLLANDKAIRDRGIVAQIERGRLPGAG